MFGQSLLSGAFGTAFAPDKNFNTLLYTGDGTSSRSITGVGFAPDFVWTKKRGTSTGNNILENAVVGPGTGQALSSNSSQVAGYNDQYGYISSFDTDGVTYQEGSSGSYPNDNANENSSTYVQWNWKSGADTHAGKFNGSSSKIDVGSGLSNSTFTVSVWFKTSYSGGTGTLINNGGQNSAETGYFLGLLASGYYRFGTSASGSGSITVDGTVALNNDAWHHIAVSYTAIGIGTSTYNIYVDGVEVSSGSNATFTGTATRPTWIGQFSYSVAGVDCWNGEIDQVRIFNTALTASQVTSLYGETSGNNNTLNFPAGAGCIAAYTLNETANDLSGNYNGTPSNITYVKPGYTGKNNDGTIESQVSVNVDAGFSVVQYTGNGTQNATVGLGLGAQAELVIIKSLSGNDAWFVGSTAMSANNFMELNTSGVATTNSNLNYTINATTIQFTGSSPHDMINKSSGNYVAYCWKSIAGFSKIGTYTWSGGYVAGTMVTGLGFKPAKVIIKGIDGSASDWQLYDNKRGATTSASKWQAYALYANEAIAESTSGYQGILFDDDGFSAGVGDDGNTTASGSLNKNGTTYLYIAIAE